MKLDKLRNKNCSIRIVLISALLAFSIGCSSTIKEVSSDLANLQKSIKSELDKLESSVNQKSNSQKEVLTEVELNSELVDFEDYEVLYYAYSWGKNITYPWKNKGLYKEDLGTQYSPSMNIYIFEDKDYTYYPNHLSVNFGKDGTKSYSTSFDDLDGFIKNYAINKSKNLVFEKPFKKSLYGNDEDFKLENYSLKYKSRLKEVFDYYNNNFFHKKLNQWLSLTNPKIITSSKIGKALKSIESICLNDLESSSIMKKEYLDEIFNSDICLIEQNEETATEFIELFLNISGASFKLDNSGSGNHEFSLILQDPSKSFKKLNILEIVKTKIFLGLIAPSVDNVTDYIKEEKLSNGTLQAYINATYKRLFEEMLFTSYYGYPPLNANIYFDSLSNVIKENLLEGISGTKDIESRIVDSDFTYEQFDFMINTLELVKLNDREKMIVEKYKNIVSAKFDNVVKAREIKLKSDEKNKLVKNFQSAYVAYLTYKACYTSREGYMSVYITKDQHNETEKQWRRFKEASPLSSVEQEKAIIDLENRPNFGLIKMLGVSSSNYSNEMSQECSMYMLIEDRFSEYK